MVRLGFKLISLFAQGFFRLFNFLDLSFKLPGTMCRLLMGFFPDFKSNTASPIWNDKGLLNDEGRLTNVE
jgi:hypothetical protein